MDERGTPSDAMGDLNPGDAALLEQLIEVNFDPAALEGVDEQTRARAGRMAAMLGLLDDYPVEPVTSDQQESLVAATMARINRAETEQHDRMRIEPGGRLPRVRLREFVAIAAVLILGLAIILPMIRSGSSIQDTTIRRAQLGQFYTALSAFESDHDGEAPSMQLEDPAFKQAIDHDPVMLDTSKLGQEYGLDKEVAEQAQGQFSFHSQQAPKIFRINFQGATVIISDRNLYLDRALGGESLPDVPLQPLVLKSDGEVGLSSCRVSQDHIWDCDKHRKAGKPVIEIFLIHSRGSQASESTPGD